MLRVRWRRAATLVAAIALLGGCSDRAPDAPAAGTENAIRVTGQGSDEANAFCAGFRLTDQQAVQFFAKAEIITEKQLHDDYEYLPCWVDGTTTSGSEKSSWRIRAGGTAEIQRADGATEWRGCKSCDDVFQ